MYHILIFTHFCRCQRDNFWKIQTTGTFLKLDSSISRPKISEEFDNWHCRFIQNVLRRPFSKKNEVFFIDMQ